MSTCMLLLALAVLVKPFAEALPNPLQPEPLQLQGFLWPEGTTDIVPVHYTANFTDPSSELLVRVGKAQTCDSEMCRHSFGKGSNWRPQAHDKSTVALFRMEDLFPAKGRIVERNLLTGDLIAEWSVDAYLYGVERMDKHGLEIPGCTYAAVAVVGSVESEPFFACVDTSDTTRPVGMAKLTKVAAFPKSRDTGQPGGEYSLVSSGPFSSHLQDRNGVYHVLLQSRGTEPTTGEGSHSAVVSVNVSSGAMAVAKYTVPQADWCKGHEPYCLSRQPVVAIAGGLDLRLNLLMARTGGVESAPVSHAALGRRYGLYWAAQAISRATGLVNASALPVKQRDVPGYKAGVSDAPEVGGGLGFAWHVTEGPMSSNVMYVAPLIPNNDTLSVDLVSVGGYEDAGTKTWRLYKYEAGTFDKSMSLRWLVASGST